MSIFQSFLFESLYLLKWFNLIVMKICVKGLRNYWTKCILFKIDFKVLAITLCSYYIFNLYCMRRYWIQYLIQLHMIAKQRINICLNQFNRSVLKRWFTDGQCYFLVHNISEDINYLIVEAGHVRGGGGARGTRVKLVPQQQVLETVLSRYIQ